MHFVLSAATLAAILTGAAAQTTLTINTPTSLVECQPTELAWTGGTAPYYLSIIPGGETSATALESLPEQTGTSYTWTVDIASGTSITVEIRDSTGTLNYSQAVTIQAGTSTSCVGTNSASAGSTTVAATASSAASAESSAASSASSSHSSASSASSSAASVSSSAASSAASVSSAHPSSATSAASAAASVASSASAAATSAAKSGAEGAVRVSGALGFVAAAVVALFA